MLNDLHVSGDPYLFSKHTPPYSLFTVVQDPAGSLANTRTPGGRLRGVIGPIGRPQKYPIPTASNIAPVALLPSHLTIPIPRDIHIS